MPNAVWKKYKDFAQKNDRLRLHSETLGTFLHDARDPHRFHFPRYFLNVVQMNLSEVRGAIQIQHRAARSDAAAGFTDGAERTVQIILNLPFFRDVKVSLPEIILHAHICRAFLHDRIVEVHRKRSEIIFDGGASEVVGVDVADCGTEAVLTPDLFAGVTDRCFRGMPRRAPSTA